MKGGIEVIAETICEDILGRLVEDGRRLVLIIDQTQANEVQQAVVVAARVGERSLSLTWRVKTTQGAIGFAEQREALEVVARLLPEGGPTNIAMVHEAGHPEPWIASSWSWRPLCSGRLQPACGPLSMRQSQTKKR